MAIERENGKTAIPLSSLRENTFISALWPFEEILITHHIGGKGNRILADVGL